MHSHWYYIGCCLGIRACIVCAFAVAFVFVLHTLLALYLHWHCFLGWVEFVLVVVSLLFLHWCLYLYCLVFCIGVCIDIVLVFAVALHWLLQWH